jgi:hypothetical protein
VTVFHDALSGKKVKLNLRERKKTPDIREPLCVDMQEGWHDFKSPDEEARCIHCGQSRLYLRAFHNIKKQK